MNKAEVCFSVKHDINGNKREICQEVYFLECKPIRTHKLQKHKNKDYGKEILLKNPALQCPICLFLLLFSLSDTPNTVHISVNNNGISFTQ